MDKERILNLYFGIATALVCGIIFAYVNKDKIVKRYTGKRNAIEERSKNPYPATLEEFCKTADPDITAPVLFENPRKHIDQRVCISGILRMEMKYMSRGNALYQILSEAKPISITFKLPLGVETFFHVGQSVTCGGYEYPPVKEDPFDYLPRVHCRYIELKDAGDERVYPEITSMFEENRWRRAIVDKLKDGTREIWMDQDDVFSLDIVGTSLEYKNVNLMFEYDSRKFNPDQSISPVRVCNIFLRAVAPDYDRVELELWLETAMRELEVERDGTRLLQLDERDIVVSIEKYNTWKISVESY